MISKIRRVLRVLRRTHITFHFPRPVAIVQIHIDGSEILTQYVDRSSISVVDPSRLNFWILLKCLFRAKFQMQGYTVEVIKAQKPRVVITFIDNDTNFYLLKSLFPSPVYIAVQNGIRNNYAYVRQGGFVDQLVRLGGTRRLTADIICTFGKSSSTLFERHIQSKTLITGNINNNMMEIASPNDSAYDIVFMSQHAPFDLENREEIMHLNSASIPIHKFYDIEGIVAKFLAQYCDQHSLRFAVSGKREIKDTYEQQFFSDAIGKIPYTFLPRTNPHSSYENGLNSRVVVVIDSTIGYELLSRGKKVAFFSARMFDPLLDPNELKDSFFGYPNSYPVSGPFWTNQPDFNEYSRILHELLGMTDAEWAVQTKPYTEDLMVYRPGNFEFIQMLINEGIQVTSEVIRRA